MSWKPSKHRIHRTPSPTQLGVKWPFSKTRNWPISSPHPPFKNIFNQATSVNWKRHWSDQISCIFSRFHSPKWAHRMDKMVTSSANPTHPPNPWHNLNPSPRPTRECRAHCTVPYSSDPRTCRNPARNSQRFYPPTKTLGKIWEKHPIILPNFEMKAIKIHVFSQWV